MAFILRLLPFRIFILVLVLHGLCYLLIRTLGNNFSEPQAKESLDLAIARHTKLALRHLAYRQVTGSRETMETIGKAQTRLACYIQRGTWIIEGRNHARYHHDPNCLGNWSSLEDLNPPQTASLLCSYTPGKRIHLVGPRAFYHAQTLLLQALALHDNKSYPSRGPEGGTHYFVCGDSRNKKEPVSTLPFNPRNTSFSYRTLLVNSTRLSFSLTDRLSSMRGSQYRMTGQLTVDPQTKIQTYTSDWLTESQKAQVLILNKSPIPAPASTFDSRTGNWSFVQAIPQEVYTGLQDIDLTPRIINTALHVIFQEYLPDLVQSLYALPSTGKYQRIFFGSWYQQPICTNAGLSSNFRTTTIIWERNTNANFRQVDPWSLYYNTQVYIIDRVLPAILPHFNFTYVPMTFPFIPEFRKFESQGQRKDCLRLPPDHPIGHSLQLAFMKALLYLLQNQ